jgi:hypothetical protein
MLHRDPLRDARRLAWFLAPCAAAGFFGAMTNQLLTTHPAHAQGVPASGPVPRAELPSATIAVPPGGLFFKAPDGRIVARLYADESGGHYEVYNARGLPVAKLGAVGAAGTLALATSSGRTGLDLSGRPAIEVLNTQGQSAVSLGLGNFGLSGFVSAVQFPRSEPALTVVDGQTRVRIWHAP